jgi:hypothetical protein
MPDCYEVLHACLDPSTNDASLDADSDGITNLEEYRAGTNPCLADTDGDGCADSEELGSNPTLGGQRDPLNRWDFYDLTGDAEVDLSDTLAVLQKFGCNPGNACYDPLMDRNAPDPQRPWASEQATDGIDLTDVLVNLQQFGHSCSAPP